MRGSMTDNQSATADITRGKKKEEERTFLTTGQKYYGLLCSIGPPQLKYFARPWIRTKILPSTAGHRAVGVSGVG